MKTPYGVFPGRILLFIASIFLAFVLLFLQTGLQPAHAAPTTLNFQARLLTSGGSLVADGDYHVEFKLYDSESAGASAQGTCVGGATDDCVWVETRTTGNLVRVANGYISVNLGEVTAFGSIDWSQQYWLTMNIGGTAGSPSWDGEMSPRIQLTSVPYAFQADTLDGRDSTEFVQLDPGASAQNVNTANTAIHVNQQGGGDLLNLKAGGSSLLSLSNGGNLSVSGNGDFNGSLTVGSSNQFQINSSGAITAATGITSSGTITFSGLDCSGNANGGAITANASGVLSCTDDDSGTTSPFTTTSNVVHLKTSTDNLTVGSANNLAKLGVDGDTDEVQFLVQGHSTQTSNLLVLEQSDGTDVLSVSNAGNAALTSLVTTGDALSVTANYLTAGNALKVASTSDSLSSGSLVDINHTSTYNSDVGVSGDLLQIERDLSADVGNATITHDSSSYGAAASTTSMSWSHTTGTGSDRILVVTVSSEGSASVSGITYNSQSLTKIGSDQYSGLTHEMWYLLNPSFGTYTVNVTFNSSASDATGGSVTFFGVDQGSPLGTYVSQSGSTSGNPPALSVSSQADDVVVDGFAGSQSYAVTGGSGQTEIYNQSQSFHRGAASYKLATTTTTNMEWNWGNNGMGYAQGGVALKRAGNGTLTVNGSLASLTSNCTEVGSTVCNDSSKLLNINQQFTSATGTVLNIQNAGTGDSLNVDNGALVVDGNGDTSFSGSLTIGDANTDSLTINAGSSGSGITLGDSSFQSCSALETDASGVLTCGTDDTGGAGAFTTTSNVVHLQTNTDDVTIGSSTQLAKLAVDGDTDEVQLLVQGHSTQTSNLLVLEQNDGTDVLTVTNAGNTNVAGTLTVAGATTLSSTLDVTGTTSLDGAVNLGDATSDDITFNGNVASDILPKTDDTYDLGSSTQRWQDLYLGPNSLHVGTDGNEGVLSYNTTSSRFELDSDLYTQQTVTIQNSSTGALNINNASSGEVLKVDTTNSQITVNGQNQEDINGWTATTALPYSRQDASSLAYNGYVYSTGGTGGSFSTPDSDVSRAKILPDGSLGSWSSEGMLGARQEHVAVAYNSFMYIISGNSSYAFSPSVTNSVWVAKINPDTGSVGAGWRGLTGLPSSLRLARGVAYNGYIYVVGGNNGSSTVSTVYYARVNNDGTLGTWNTTSASLPAARQSHDVVVANGRLYVTGGYNGGAVSSVYFGAIGSDGDISSWTTATNSLPATRADHESIMLNGYLYVMGGGSSGATNTVYYSKINSSTGQPGTWSTSTNLPASKLGLGVVTYNGYVYQLGGSYTTNTYYGSASRTRIAGSLDLTDIAGSDIMNANGMAGTLSAGNTNVLGDLRVTQTSQFLQQATFSSDVLIDSPDSTLQVVNKSGGGTVKPLKLHNDTNTTGSKVAIDFGVSLRYETVNAQLGVEKTGSNGEGSIYFSTHNGTSLQEAGRFDSSGNLALGASSGNEKLTLDGRLSLQETTSPTDSTGYGKLFVKSTDSKLYYRNDSGTEYDLTQVGSCSTCADTSLSNLSSVAINTHLLPDTDDSYDLGSSSLRWRDLYLGPQSLHIGTNGNEATIGYNTTSNYLQLDASEVRFTGDVVASTAPTESTFTRSITTVDSTNDVGYRSAIDIGSDGYARIAYHYSTSSDLRFMQCTNADCSSSNVNDVETSINAGEYLDMELGTDGYGRIAYYDGTNFDLKYAQCTNAACSSSNITTLDSSGNVGHYISLAIGGDGYARIAYHDSTNKDLKFIQCTNDACTTKNTTVVDSSSTDTGQYTSIKMASDGFARIAYYDHYNTTVKYAQCTNASCSTKNINSVDSNSDEKTNVALGLNDSDVASIAYHNDGTTSGGLYLTGCLDESCSSKNTTYVDSTSGAEGSGRQGVAIAMLEGLPHIAYDLNKDGTLTYVYCNTASCSTKNKTLVHAPSDNIFNISMTVGNDGYSKISYYIGDTTDVLSFVSCANITCEATGYNYSGGISIGSTSNYFNSIYAAKMYAKSGNFSGFDLAENYKVDDVSIEPGDIVSIEHGTTVGKSDGAYDSMMIGVVSTQPGLTLSEWEKDSSTRPIALAGRVPVKVIGPVAVGDPITASDVPGVGMKAEQPGRIVGYALTAYSGSGQGAVTMFVEPGYHTPTLSELLQDPQAMQGVNLSVANLHVLGASTTKDLLVTSTANIEVLTVSGKSHFKGTLTFAGQLVSEGDRPTVLAGVATGVDGEVTIEGTDSAGTLTIHVIAGENLDGQQETLKSGSSAKITFSEPFSVMPRVQLTPINRESSRIKFFVQKDDKGFSVVFTEVPVNEEVYKFDYFVIGSQTPEEPTSTQGGSATQ